MKTGIVYILTPFLLWLLPGPSAAADISVDQLVKMKSCITNLNNAASHFERANNIWITDKESAFSVSKRFELVKDFHAKYRQDIEAFAKKFDETAGNKNEILEKLSKLNHSRMDLAVTFDSVDRIDQSFVISLTGIDDVFMDIGSKYMAIAENCKEFAKQELDEATGAINELRDDISYLQSYITISSQKRSSLFEAIYYGILAKLTQRYADIEQVNIDQARLDLQRVLVSETILDNITQWWADTHGRTGLGQGLIGLYLQYTKPLAIMKNDLLRAKVIETQLADPALDPDSVRSLNAEFRPKVDLLARQIGDLENKGHEGILLQQSAMNKRRIETIDLYAEACKEATSVYDATIKKYQTSSDQESDFLGLEAAYLTSVFNCTRRQP